MPQVPEADRTAGGDARAARRHSGLSALGTFFAGVAALMTVLTAAATSYITYVTYQNQQKQDAQNEEAAAADFAQRVEFTPGPSGSMTLDNPNNFPLSNVVITAAFSYQNDAKEIYYFTLNSHERILPACSRIAIPYAKEWPGEAGDSPRQGQAAYFEDRLGQAWRSTGATSFTKTPPVDWKSYREGAPFIWEDGKEYTFHENEMSLSISKSPRCK